MLIRGGTLLHLDPLRVVRVDLRVKDGIIEELGAELASRPGEETVELAGAALMPGLVNAHHHIYSALATGMPMPERAPESFSAMLEQVWWRMDEALDLSTVRACGLVGGLAALRAGVTTVVDHHASPSAIDGALLTLDDALDEVGLRRVLCYEVTDRGGPERARAGVEAHRALLSAGRAGGKRATLIGGHASFTLSDETLRSMVALATEAGVGLHMHVAEAVDDARRTGEPVVPRLARLGALLPGSVFAHGVHLSPDDLRQIEDAGAFLTHQPRSNMNNAVGYAPLRHAGANTALGTDGIGSDMFTELQAGYFRSQEEGVGWGPDRWLAALSTGARLAGGALGVRLGQLRPGAAADLVVLEPSAGPPLSAASLGAAMVFRMGSAMVRHVMISGRWRLWNRAPTTLNIAQVNSEAHAAADALWGRMRAGCNRP